MYDGLHAVEGGQSTEQMDPQALRDAVDELPSGIQNFAFPQVNGVFSEL